MEALFLRILTLSLTTSAVLLPLLVFLPRLRSRYAPRTCYFLWLVLALRLLLPFELPNPQPVVTVAAPDYAVTLPALSQSQPQTRPAAPAQSAGQDAGAAGVQTAPTPAAPAQPERTLPLTALLGWLWLAGGLAVLLWQGGSYLLARRALLRAARPAEGAAQALLAQQCRDLSLSPVPLLRTGRVDTPVMLGLLRPAILLPAELPAGADMALALRHELLHLRRHDVAYKALLLVCTAVHWFNPLVWWMGREAGRNLELCCDEAVLRGGDAAQRRQYGELLLRSAQARGSLPFSTRFGGGGAQLKSRLYNLFHTKRRSRALVAACLAAALLAGGLVACEGTGSGRITEEEAMDLLEESIRYEDEALSFTIPDRETPSHPWVSHLAGRAAMGPGNSMSVHYMDNVDWTPGETYTQPISAQEAAAMAELTMDITLGQKERSIDLLPYLQAAAYADTPDSLTLSLDNAEQVVLTPLSNIEPDVVSADTMGEVLVDKTLSDGARIVCYWEPGSEYTKYWAIREGDTLLRFCQEYSAYAGGYDVTEYTNVLGHDGFRIEAPRGAAYHAYDYYYFDETGTPRFLASCANEVLEADFNSDGVAELLWFSHGYMAIYCFQLDGAVYEVDLNRLIQEARPQWEEIMAPATGIERASDPLLPFSYVEGGVPHTGTITFLPDAIRVDLS